ncbi:MAG: ATP-binding protein [Melioribacteraceae bacterium]|nr:MAG: ATP-binding protein [Melioribacteraceae bacterium]
MPAETYTIQSKYKNVNIAADSIKQFCQRNNIAEPACNDILICVIEALNNVITHSYQREEDKNIDIILTVEDSWFIIDITDEGIARTNFEKPKLEFDPEDIQNLPEGGMGLYIIENLMDSTSYKSAGGKNTFTMKKNLNHK